MDKLYQYGLSELFLLIALAAAKKYQINLEFSHLDSSSFSVHGQYNRARYSEDKSTKKESDGEIEPIPITITHGYSRDKRPDLKQFILDLIVTGDGNIPVFIEAASGNQSDKKAFGKSEIDGYSFVEKTSNYGGIPQRWLVVKSEARGESDKKSLEKKITKEQKLINKKLAKLFKKTFTNATAAELSLKQIKSKLKYHLISDIEIIENQVNHQNNTYQITGEIQPDSEVIESYKNRAGRFIIATNRLDYESFTADEMLKRYKEQQNVERGFVTRSYMRSGLHLSH